MKILLLPAAALLLFISCHSTKLSTGMNPGIEGREWLLVELMGNPVVNPSPSGKSMTFRLDKAAGRLCAYAGCNNLAGSYTLETGNRIRFNHVASTMMACPEMNLENELKQVLEMTDNYAIADGRLSLHKARMAPLARFTARQ